MISSTLSLIDNANRTEIKASSVITMNQKGRLFLSFPEKYGENPINKITELLSKGKSFYYFTSPETHKSEDIKPTVIKAMAEPRKVAGISAATKRSRSAAKVPILGKPMHQNHKRQTLLNYERIYINNATPYRAVCSYQRQENAE